MPTPVHSKKQVVLLGGFDLSLNTNNKQGEESSDTHDVTGYGTDAHVFAVGLDNGKGTLSGFYDSTAGTGPRAVIKGLRAARAATTLISRPEGTGSGLPQDTVSVIIEKYTETAPVADMITWSCDLQYSGTVDSTPQP